MGRVVINERLGPGGLDRDDVGGNTSPEQLERPAFASSRLTVAGERSPTDGPWSTSGDGFAPPSTRRSQRANQPRSSNSKPSSPEGSSDVLGYQARCGDALAALVDAVLATEMD